MTWYELWLFLHIGATVLWAGGAVTAQVFAALAKRSGDPARAAAFGQDMAFVATRVFMPAALVVLATGLVLTENGNWDWGEPFIVFGLVAWFAVAGIGSSANSSSWLGSSYCSSS